MMARTRVRLTAMVGMVAVLAMVALACVAAPVDARPGVLQPGAAQRQQQTKSTAAAKLQAVMASSAKSTSAAAAGSRARSKLGSYYHSTREIYDEIKQISTKCSHLTIGWERAPASVDGRKKSLMTVRLNFEAATYPKKQERALLFFGEHARELISPETGLEFIRRACDPSLLDARMKNVDGSLRDILRTTEFMIFPIANPSGRRITERGAYCNRVNDRRVDLNRNWGEHWSSESNHRDTYPGTKAWSEAETVILAHSAATFAPTIFIAVHSGSLNMLSPFAFKGTEGGEPAASRTAIDPPSISIKPIEDGLKGTGIQPVLKVLKHVNRDFCRCRVGAAGKELGYLSPGTCLDYIYNRIGTRHSFAVEIYSGRGYAGKRQRALPKPSSLLQEDMTAERMSFAHEQELEEEAALEAEAEAEDNEGLMEVESEFFTRSETEARPSFEPPEYTQEDRSLMSLSSEATTLATDGDLPEQSVVFPRAQRGRSRRCLSSFNPVTERMYKKTVDHWSRGLLSLVHTIGHTRPKTTEE